MGGYIVVENKVGIILMIIALILWVMIIFKALVDFDFIAKSTVLLLQKLSVQYEVYKTFAL